MSLTSEGKMDLPSLYEWCPEFDQARTPLVGDDENYIKILSEINPNTDDITLFTDEEDPDQMPNEEAETILSFCQSVRTSAAFHETAKARRVALIHEWDSMKRSREPYTPLTVTQLYQALSKPVRKIQFPSSFNLFCH